MFGVLLAVGFMGVLTLIFAWLAWRVPTLLVKILCGGMAVFFGLITIASMLGGLVKALPGDDSPATQAASKPADAFAEMTAAQHLDRAKGFHPSAIDAIDNAKRHLAAIDKSAPEYKEAVKLGASLDKRRVELEIEKDPIEVVKSSWETSGFGTIGMWRVTFKNKSGRPVGNIKYRTTYYSETGSLVDKGGVDTPLIADSKTVQKVIPPKASRTLEINDGFVNQQANRAKFELVAWEFVADMR